MKGDNITLGSLLDKSLSFFRDNFAILITFGLLFSFLPKLILTLTFSEFYVLIEELTPEQVMENMISMAPYTLLSMAISVFMVIGVLHFVFLKSKNNRSYSFGEVFNGSNGYFIRTIALSIVMGIALLVAFILLIIPGVILYIYWIFATSALVMSNKKVMSCFSHSASLVKGRWWRTFGYMVVVIFVSSVFAGIISYPFGLISNEAGVIVSDLASTITAVFVLVFTAQYYLAITSERKESLDEVNVVAKIKRKKK